MIDIYDVVSNSWSTAQLKEPRWSITAATVGNKVFFAGVISVNNTIYIAGGSFPYHTPTSNQVWKLEF